MAWDGWDPPQPELTNCILCGDEIIDCDEESGGEQYDNGRACWRCERWTNPEAREAAAEANARRRREAA
jgi:hypothetical protein